MSDQPQPRDDPPPAHIVEEPPIPDDWDEDEDEDDYPPAKASWDDGWPGPEHWWP
jgi:hypothetical protein